MKIGILTFHRSTNFGSLLQTYGLYKKINDLGYDCEIIDYRCEAIETAENLKVKLDIKYPKEIIKTILFQPIQNKKAKEFRRFTFTHMKLSRPCNENDISDLENNYDKIIVGSDIVWGRDITHDDYTYFLDFVRDNKKKFAFSSSVGNCVIRNDESKLKKLLNEFQKIAVREKDAVEWVNQISGVNAYWVCDPTMLLTAKEWEKIIPISKRRGKYVLVYFDDPRHKCLHDAIKYGELHHMKVYFIKYGLPVKGTDCKQPTTLDEFLSLIKNAEMIFTASYHGMLFSVYFEKQFMFYTRAHKSRFLSIADRLGLMDQCGDRKNISDYHKIDYGIVNSKVQSFRNYSIKILKDMLEDG